MYAVPFLFMRFFSRISTVLQRSPCPPPAARSSVRRHGLFSPSLAWESIQEGHVPHGPGLALGVHQNPVPTMQGNGGVVGVPDAALDVDVGVAPHSAPTPTLRLRAAGHDLPVLRLRDAVGVAGADVDRLATRAVAELGPMRLAAVAPTQRLVPQDQLLVHGQVSDREEEPLALTTVGGVLAAAAGLGLEPLAGLGGLDLGRLEGFLGLTDGADRGGFGDAGDEPVPLVIAAEELALVPALTDEKKQVAVGRLNVEDDDLGLGPHRTDDLEELALAVGLHVQGDDARRAAAAGRVVGHLQASAEAGELASEVRLHEGKDTTAPAQVRHRPICNKMTAT